MKNCPKCNNEVDDNFDVCWNCNYSFSEGKKLDFVDSESGSRVFNNFETPSVIKQIDCLRCKVEMNYSGNFKFHEGTRLGFLGNFFEAFTNRESFELYICPQCGKVEFFSPEIY